MTQRGVSVVALDDQARRLVVFGLQLAEERIRRDGLRPPATLAELRDALSPDATGSHETPIFDGDGLESETGYMNAKQAAEFCRLSPRTLARRTADGTIPSVKVGARRLYRRSDLEEL